MDLLAYLDAGSASALMTAIAGGFAAVAVMARIYWNRILVFLHIRKPEDEAARHEQPDSA